MFFDSPKHYTKHHHQAKHHHHAKHPQSYTSNDYQVYATTIEQEPTKLLDAPPRRHAYMPFNTDYEERVFEAPRRTQVIEYYERAPVLVKADSYEVCDVDAEADDFIKLEHKKFGISKWKSVKTG